MKKDTNSLLDRIDYYIKSNLDSNRYNHSLRVRDEALSLAEVHGEDISKAQIAALLHDCAKGLSYEELLDKANKLGAILDESDLESPKTLHAYIGAYIAKIEFGIIDEDIFNAIKNHSLGRPNMSILEKIIFVADFTELGRGFKEAKFIRKVAETDLDRAMLEVIDMTLNYLIKEKAHINPKTIITRNYLLKEL